MELTLWTDCYCIPSGFYTIGSTKPTWEVVQGIDDSATPYVGIILSDTYTPTNQTFQQYWFLRGEETGLHMFSRVSYYNEETPFLRNLQEMRTLFRPNAGLGLWTHLSTNDVQTAPLPSQNALSKGVVVQDATWSLKATPDDKYVTQFSEWFTKYTFSSGEFFFFFFFFFFFLFQ
jgi:rhamnogalacturonan endolyase